jgi:hypothetical protein
MRLYLYCCCQRSHEAQLAAACWLLTAICCCCGNRWVSSHGMSAPLHPSNPAYTLLHPCMLHAASAASLPRRRCWDCPAASRLCRRSLRRSSCAVGDRGEHQGGPDGRIGGKASGSFLSSVAFLFFWMPARKRKRKPTLKAAELAAASSGGASAQGRASKTPAGLSLVRCRQRTRRWVP